MNQIQYNYDMAMRLYGKSDGDIQFLLKPYEEGNKSDDWCFLYTKSKLKLGFIINYDNAQWLVIQEDTKIVEQYQRYMVQKCNKTINFLIDGDIFPIPCCVGKSEFTTTPSTPIKLLKGGISVKVPQIEITDKIKINDRIIMFRQAWKLFGLTYPNIGILNLDFDTDELAAGDDIINEIPTGVAVYRVVIGKGITEVTVGDSIALTTTVYRDDKIIEKELEWITSDATVCTVVGGMVTGVSEGQVTITCRLKDKTEISDNIELTIKSAQVDIYEISVTPVDVRVYQGDTNTYNCIMKKNGEIITWNDWKVTVVGTNVPVANYEFKKLVGNQYSIKCKKYTSQKLKIRIESIGIDAIPLEIDYQLKGGF